MDVHSPVRDAGAVTQAFVQKVFNWMGFGLLLTAVTAAWVSGSPEALNAIFGSQFTFFGLILSELALVWVLTRYATTMAPAMAGGMFILYSLVNGATLSVIFLAYTSESIASTFFVASGMFVATAIYGYVTKRDLSSMGGFLFMGVIGLVLAGVVNIFWQNDAFALMVAAAGVVVFTALTAYDMQKIKYMAEEGEENTGAAIVGALVLYLDFVNLFIYLLRILGRRK